MKTKCILVKLKKGSLERVNEWAAMLNSRKNEVIETLKNEGVVLETVFLAQIRAEDYLVYFMRSEDFDKAHRVGKNSLAAIDAYHQKFKADTWLERAELNNLIDFECEKPQQA